MLTQTADTGLPMTAYNALHTSPFERLGDVAGHVALSVHLDRVVAYSSGV